MENSDTDESSTSSSNGEQEKCDANGDSKSVMSKSEKARPSEAHIIEFT